MPTLLGVIVTKAHMASEVPKESFAPIRWVTKPTIWRGGRKAAWPKQFPMIYQLSFRFEERVRGVCTARHGRRASTLEARTRCIGQDRVRNYSPDFGAHIGEWNLPVSISLIHGRGTWKELSKLARLQRIDSRIAKLNLKDEWGGTSCSVEVLSPN
jgi:hypothetical protein